jgi:hypothetical protein
VRTTTLNLTLSGMHERGPDERMSVSDDGYAVRFLNTVNAAGTALMTAPLVTSYFTLSRMTPMVT